MQIMLIAVANQILTFEGKRPPDKVVFWPIPNIGRSLEVLGNLWISLIQRLSSEVVKIPAGENRYNLYITRKTLAGTVNSIADTLRT